MKSDSISRCLLALGMACFFAGAVQSAEPEKKADEQQLEQKLAVAREKLDAAARELGVLSAQLGRDTANRVITQYQLIGPSMRLGVQVQRSSGGANVMAVDPGSPADAAGIKQGDVITAIGGADLTKAEDSAKALLDHVRELSPGLKVKLAVLREGKKLDFDVTPRSGQLTGRVPGMNIDMRPGMGPLVIEAPTMEIGGSRDGMRILSLRGSGPERFRGMEFATLSERLGSYFGVKSGVLVVRGGEQGVFKLQDGDVILAIDGREPTSAAHATRILGSYQPGEKLTLKIMRDRRNQNVEVTLPDAGPRPGRG